MCVCVCVCVSARRASSFHMYKHIKIHIRAGVHMGGLPRLPEECPLTSPEPVSSLPPRLHARVLTCTTYIHTYTHIKMHIHIQVFIWGSFPGSPEERPLTSPEPVASLPPHLHARVLTCTADEVIICAGKMVQEVDKWRVSQRGYVIGLQELLDRIDMAAEVHTYVHVCMYA
jgi:hypothetical protein